MTAKERNFWVLLTAIAITAVAFRWTMVPRHHHYEYRFVSSSLHNQSCDKQSKRSSATYLSSYREARPLNLTYFKRKIKKGHSAHRHHYVRGNAQVRVWVNQRGRYQRHVIMHSSNSKLTYRINRYVKDLRFSPARKGNRSVSSFVDMNISL